MFRILLAEDRADVREMLEKTLRDVGYELDCAGTCAAALKSLEADTHDLLISDIRLLDGSGHDLAKRAMALGMKVILISGHSREIGKDRKKIQYLRKPFLMRALLDAVEQSVGVPMPPPDVSDEPALLDVREEPVLSMPPSETLH